MGWEGIFSAKREEKEKYEKRAKVWEKDVDWPLFLFWHFRKPSAKPQSNLIPSFLFCFHRREFSSTVRGTTTYGITEIEDREIKIQLH